MTQPGYRPGERGYRRVVVALFLAGLVTFALLYATQPMLPELSLRFGVSATAAATSVSAGTLALGVALLIAGPVTELVGRTPLMIGSLFAASVVGMACAFAPTWEVMLGLRALQGFLLAGLPAVATAYLREEIARDAAGRATGLYIGGTALGGMSGRLIGGTLTDFFGWQVALFGLGLLGLVCAIATTVLLPRSRNFRPSPKTLHAVLGTLRKALADPALLGLYGIGGTSMGMLVATFNALGFRLAAPPYLLPLSLASLVFLTYAVGSWSSTYAGRLADLYGRRRVEPICVVIALVGLLITLAEPLWLVVLGLAVLVAGFFATHGVASGWVAARAAATGGGAGQAASLYLVCYYLGSSIFGTLAGTAWTHAGWPGVVAMNTGLLLICLVLALLVGRTRPVLPAP
ncbi:MFS transporter [Granulicoccus phenolivorans]|uniref:MFS transporter n=1 Tax=Granulicoccus phenolivorans TaxID=266854 RepID=UPI00041F6E73|nr:MFS transporter [Granulicoccus phenolivorans]